MIQTIFSACLSLLLAGVATPIWYKLFRRNIEESLIAAMLAALLTFGAPSVLLIIGNTLGLPFTTITLWCSLAALSLVGLAIRFLPSERRSHHRS